VTLGRTRSWPANSDEVRTQIVHPTVKIASDLAIFWNPEINGLFFQIWDQYTSENDVA
jgi:hypothetical protein